MGYQAKKYQIDVNKLGINGDSAGSHLSLMIATAYNNMNTLFKVPVDRVSSRVQAVACFFPPTDFLNYGKAGENVLMNKTILERANVTAAVDFTRWDTISKQFIAITDLATRTKIVKQISPIYQVTSDDPPVLIGHGD